MHSGVMRMCGDIIGRTETDFNSPVYSSFSVFMSRCFLCFFYGNQRLNVILLTG